MDQTCDTETPTPERNGRPWTTSDLCWFFSQEENWIRKQIAMAGLPPGYKIPGAKNRWWEPEEIRSWWNATVLRRDAT